MFKSGRVLPVKFSLTDAAGAPVTNAVAHISVFKLQDGGGSPVPVAVKAAGNSGTGNLLRFDASTGLYIYNLDTNGYLGTFLIRVSLDDGSSYAVNVTMR